MGIRAWDTVIWPALRVPLNSARNVNAHGPARSFITRKPSRMLWARFRANIHRSRVCRSKRSARYPTKGVENTLGNMAAKVMMPTHRDASVSSHARYPRITIRAQAAAPEQVVAIHMVR